MRPTQYNKRITVQVPTETRTSNQGKSIAYTDSYTTWAHVQAIRGRKRLEYGLLNYNYLYEVEMRARRTNPSVTDKIKYGGEEYTIISVIEDDDKVNIDIGR